MLDFTILTDEQLLQLLEGCMRETLNRGTEMTAAAREIMLSEKEKAEIAAQATQRAKERLMREEAERIAREAEQREWEKARAAEEAAQQEKVKNAWLKEKALGEELSALLGIDDLYVTVWDNKDKRVYLQRDRFFGDEIGCLYVTGNSKNPPGDFPTKSLKKYLPEGKDFEEFQSEVKAVLMKYSHGWRHGKFEIPKALKYEPATV